MQVLDAIHFWCRTIPERPAFIRPDGVTNYLALAQGVERAAEYFAQSVPDRSRPILLALATAPKALLASLGLLRANLSVIVAQPSTLGLLPKGASNTLIHERDGPTLADGTNIVFDESWLRGGTSSSQEHARAFPLSRSNAAEFFSIVPGTGSSGRIARMLRPSEQDTSYNCVFGFADFDRAMMLLGVDNATGFTRAYQILGSGKSLCFAPPGPTMPWMMDTFRVETVFATSEQARALSELQEKLTRYPLKSLKSLRLSGTPLPAHDMMLIKNHLCRNVIVDYAPPETGPIATAPHDMIADIPDAVGFVLPQAEVQIVDDDGRLMKTNVEGRVRVRTPQFLRNFQIDDLTAWFYTGHSGRLTDANILCITGPAPRRAEELQGVVR